MELALNQPAPLLKRLSWFDWLFAAIVTASGLFALSQYGDFMDLYEAPDVRTAHKVSVISRAEGAVSAESWQAMPYDDFLHLLAEVEP